MRLVKKSVSLCANRKIIHKSKKIIIQWFDVPNFIRSFALLVLCKLIINLFIFYLFIYYEHLHWKLELQCSGK